MEFSEKTDRALFVFSQLLHRLFQPSNLPQNQDLVSDLPLFNDLGLFSPRSMRQVADLLGIKPSTATERVQKLEKMQYITRKQSTKDRRRTNLELTPKGYEIYEALRDFRHRALSHLFPDSQQELLVSLLNNIEKFVYHLHPEFAPNENE